MKETGSATASPRDFVCKSTTLPYQRHNYLWQGMEYIGVSNVRWGNFSFPHRSDTVSKNADKWDLSSKKNGNSFVRTRDNQKLWNVEWRRLVRFGNVFTYGVMVKAVFNDLFVQPIGSSHFKTDCCVFRYQWNILKTFHSEMSWMWRQILIFVFKCCFWIVVFKQNVTRKSVHKMLKRLIV